VEAQVDPGLCFSLEVLLVLLCLEVFRPGTLDSQIDIPAPVMNTINEPHPAALVHRLHLVQIEDYIARLPDGGYTLLGLGASLVAGRQGVHGHS
jgi:hypothetical protein